MLSCFIENQQIRAEFLTQGAELAGLRTVGGRELLWDGDPLVWPRKAPVLFPIVGRLKDDQLVHEGKRYPMPKHGFARDSMFELVRLSREECYFRLRDNEQTREMYPFPFELGIKYSVRERTLLVEHEVANRGTTPMYASLGAHPAFRWPLLPGAPREDHSIRFEKPEPAPIRCLDDKGLLLDESSPSPVREGILHLRDSLFEHDALIFDDLKSRCLDYESPDGLALRVEWRGFQQLGIWTKPEARFLCIEPWHGMASGQAFSGEFKDKPGVFMVEPGRRKEFSYAVTVLTNR